MEKARLIKNQQNVKIVFFNFLRPELTNSYRLARAQMRALAVCRVSSTLNP